MVKRFLNGFLFINKLIQVPDEWEESRTEKVKQTVKMIKNHKVFHLNFN